ncbi:hypothetical protein ElyMa_002505300 [Elysia marginata]|uniref:BRO1 domain-containing protein n=1 Tax=Elysia marginata TaxID=1093978 RepID=A0AAV4GRF2_9GAST|nr:hypothetical protein ElyMa_002505300 [Elysia marginata]
MLCEAVHPPPALSNIGASSLAHLETWLTSLTRYAQALSGYVADIDDFAQKSFPTARAAYQWALNDAASLSTPNAVVAPSAGDSVAFAAEKAFAIFARLEKTFEALDSGAAAAAKPSLLEEATQQMSQNYAEKLRKKVQAVHEARASAALAARAGGEALSAAWAPELAKGEPCDLARAYATGAKSTAGAVLFASVLVEWERSGKNIQAFAEGAKDEALGIPPDSSAAVERNTATHALMHPLQAMGVTFGLVPIAEKKPSKGGAITIDATLPQAKTAVRYNVDPLVDLRAAAKFGPLANVFTGLNYRLVERLKTITEEAIPPGERPAPKLAIDDEPIAVLRTIDGGGTFQAMRGPLPAKAYATVGAGPRPRVAQIGELLEAAVFSAEVPAAAGPPRTIRNPSRLVEDYNAQADFMDPLISLSELGHTLVLNFGKLYDTAKPANAEAFKAIVLGEGVSRDPFRSYIAQTISEVSKRATERRLVRNEISRALGSALLFGGRRQAAKGGRQEGLLTTLVQLRQSISAAAGKIARAYDQMDADAKARRIFAPAGLGRLEYSMGDGGTARAVRAVSRCRMQAMALYRALVEEAFYSAHKPRSRRAAQAVEKLDAVSPRPSLKLYVLGRGDTSNTL